VLRTYGISAADFAAASCAADTSPSRGEGAALVVPSGEPMSGCRDNGATGSHIEGADAAGGHEERASSSRMEEGGDSAENTDGDSSTGGRWRDALEKAQAGCEEDGEWLSGSKEGSLDDEATLEEEEALAAAEGSACAGAEEAALLAAADTPLEDILAEYAGACAPRAPTAVADPALAAAAAAAAAADGEAGAAGAAAAMVTAVAAPEQHWAAELLGAGGQVDDVKEVGMESGGEEDWMQSGTEDDEGTLEAEEVLAALGGAQVGDVSP
jgi:hypothetical protein